MFWRTPAKQKEFIRPISAALVTKAIHVLLYRKSKLVLFMGEKHYRQVLGVPSSSPDSDENVPTYNIELSPPEA